MTVIDAHAHVWHPGVLEYPWLRRAPDLDGPWLPSDIDDAGGAVTGWVFVEADPVASAARAETRWVASLDWPGLRAIVAHADPMADRLEELLTDLRTEPLVRGVRRVLQGLPDEALIDPGLSRGLSAIASSGLVFDACVTWRQLPTLHRVLSEVPELVVVLDHLGKPPVDKGVNSVDGQFWSEAMLQLAELPRLHMKLSGLAAEASSPALLAAYSDGFLARALEIFGPTRCLFGTDWPVSAESAAGISAEAWLRRVKAVAGQDAHDVVAGTARRVYGLDEVSSD